MAVDVDSVQPRDEVYKNVVDALGDFLEEGRCDLFVGGVLLQVNGDEELLSLLIYVANIDTALVCEQDPITLLNLVSVFSGQCKAACS